MANLIIKYVKTFKDVCDMLLIDENKFNEYYKFLNKSELAFKKLKLIIKVLNNDWIPKLDGTEIMYTPYFSYDKELDSFSYYSYGSWFTGSNLGFGLGFKNSELCEYCGKQFIDLWNDYLRYDTNEDYEEIKKYCK